MRRPSIDSALAAVLAPAALVSGALFALIILFLLREALPALAGVGPRELLLGRGWYPDADPGEGAFGLAPMIAGTLAASAGAVLVATPLGLLSAVFVEEIAPRPVAWVQRRVVALLAGIPSVVYGLWGLVVLVPAIRALRPPGASLLAGTIVLAAMIVPTIALVCGGALAAVPRELVAGAEALGLSRVGRLRAVTWPTVRRAVVAAVLLAAGRAIGETMAILMVAGNIVQFPGSPFDPVRTLTANIALEMGYASGAHRAALFASGLVLMALIVLVVVAAARVGRVRDSGPVA